MEATFIPSGSGLLGQPTPQEPARAGDFLPQKPESTTLNLHPDFVSLLGPSHAKKVADACRLTALKMQMKRDHAMYHYYYNLAELFQP